MNPIIPLKCSACGASLKPNSQIGQFTCPNCGSEYLVPQSVPYPAAQFPAVSTAQPAPAPAVVKQAGLKTKTEVLLELLRRVPDAKQLDILLETHNLLALLLTHGYSAERVELELRTGKIPGQLLLELLDLEPDPGVLLRQLDPTMPAPPPADPNKPVPAPMLRSYSILARLMKGTNTSAPVREKYQVLVMGGLFILFGIVLGGIGTWLALRPDPILNTMVISLIVSGPVLILLGGFILLTRRSPQ